MTPSSTAPAARIVVNAPGAPAAIGPYAHANRFGDLLFCSGVLPVDPTTGAVVPGGPGAWTTQCLRNLDAVCAAAGTTLHDALRLTLYTTDLGQFEHINAAYARFFTTDPPARVTIQVAALPAGAGLEIDAIVACP